MKLLKSYKFWFAVYLLSLIGGMMLFRYGDMVHFPWVLGLSWVSGVISLFTFKFEKL